MSLTDPVRSVRSLETRTALPRGSNTSNTSNSGLWGLGVQTPAHLHQSPRFGQTLQVHVRLRPLDPHHGRGLILVRALCTELHETTDPATGRHAVTAVIPLDQPAI